MTRLESIAQRVNLLEVIDMYLNQISLTGGIPFAVTLPNAPSVLNTDLMTTEEIRRKLQEGYDDMQAGRVQDAVSAFAKFRESHSCEI